jgi:hypothetical protein
MLKARTLATYHTNNPTVNDYGGEKPSSQNTLLLRHVGTVENCVACAPPPAGGLCDTTSLDTVATYLRNYMTEFRNSNFWAYSCDGNGYYIDDGGDDMYDDGNYTTPWLLSGTTYASVIDDEEDYPFAISYETTSQTTVDTDFRYVSLGYVAGEDTDEPQPDDSRHPLTVLGYRCDGPVGWQVGGELGADDDGNMMSAILYAGETVNGFTVHAAHRQVYNADDPTVCNLIILLGRAAWGSAFGPITMYSDESTTNSNGFYFYAGTGSKHVLAIHTVLSKPEGDDGTPIPDSELQTVVGNFTLRIAQALGL